MKGERWKRAERVNIPERKDWMCWDSSTGDIRKKSHFRNQRSILRHKDAL